MLSSRSRTRSAASRREDSREYTTTSAQGDDPQQRPATQRGAGHQDRPEQTGLQCDRQHRTTSPDPRAPARHCTHRCTQRAIRGTRRLDQRCAPPSVHVPTGPDPTAPPPHHRTPRGIAPAAPPAAGPPPPPPTPDHPTRPPARHHPTPRARHRAAGEDEDEVVCVGAPALHRGPAVDTHGQMPIGCPASVDKLPDTPDPAHHLTVARQFTKWKLLNFQSTRIIFSSLFSRRSRTSYPSLLARYIMIP